MDQIRQLAGGTCGEHEMLQDISLQDFSCKQIGCFSDQLVTAWNSKSIPTHVTCQQFMCFQQCTDLRIGPQLGTLWMLQKSASTRLHLLIEQLSSKTDEKPTPMNPTGEFFGAHGT